MNLSFPQSLSSLLSLLQHIDKVKLPQQSPQSSGSSTNTLLLAEHNTHSNIESSKTLTKPANNMAVSPVHGSQREVVGFVLDAVTEFVDLDKVGRGN